MFPNPCTHPCPEGGAQMGAGVCHAGSCPDIPPPPHTHHLSLL